MSTNTKASGSDLVMTEAGLPPGIDAPSPRAERDRIAAGDAMPADVAGELRNLARRVGGIDRLRELVDKLAESTR